MTEIDTRPEFVQREPRYVADSFGEIWNLDGVSWHDAPAPTEKGHKHWAQTIGWAGLDLIRRCPCSAISWNRPDGWFWATEREKRWAPRKVGTGRSRFLPGRWKR